MDRIRLLLANYPVMVPDAIRQLLAEQEDMEVVGDCRGPMKILQATGQLKADAVIFAQDGDNEPGFLSHLLAVYPDITILGLGPEEKTACTWQLCPWRHDIMNTENENIVGVFRAVVRERCRKAGN